MSIKVNKGGISTEIEKWDLDFYKRTGWTIESEQSEVVEIPVAKEESIPSEAIEAPVAKEKPAKGK